MAAESCIPVSTQHHNFTGYSVSVFPEMECGKILRGVVLPGVPSSFSRFYRPCEGGDQRQLPVGILCQALSDSSPSAFIADTSILLSEDETK